MLVYPSGLDLSSSILRFLSDPLNARRRERGTRWRRLPSDRQALLVLAHLRRRHTYPQLAAGFGVEVATVYRYVAKAVEILAVPAPDLAAATRAAARKAFVILDGTLLPIDRIAADRPYYSGKHRKHGMNMQASQTRSAPALGLVGSARRDSRRPRGPHPRRHRRPSLDLAADSVGFAAGSSDPGAAHFTTLRAPAPGQEWDVTWLGGARSAPADARPPSSASSARPLARGRTHYPPVP